MKKSITSLLKGWCAALLCAGLTLPSFAAADADAAFAAQRHDLKLSLHNAPLREVVTAFTQQTGVVFSYETSLGERTLPHVDVALNGSTLDEMLASVFAGTGISYKIKDKVVALSAPPQSDAPAARSAAQQRKQTVAGRVTDEQGEPLAGVSVPVQRVDTLEEATRLAYAAAQPGDVVLLSPACASLDMFRNYAHRAEVFIASARQLADEAHP